MREDIAVVLAKEGSEEDLHQLCEMHGGMIYGLALNLVTAMRSDLPEASHVDLAVYDVSGRLVCYVLDNQPKQAGYHTVYRNGRNIEGGRVAPGVYFYRLSAGSYTGIERMLLLQ